MGTPPLVAAVLLLGALPVCLWASYVDLSRLKIPNRAVLALVGVFAVLGLTLVLSGAWSLSDWAWRWSHLALVLPIGMILNVVWLIGAGDAKLAAAAAPFFAVSDLDVVLWLLPLALLACWIPHAVAKRTVGPSLAPDWASWTSGKRFPFGLAIAATLLAYLGLCAAA